jgi:hypothetical protein
MVRDGLDAVGRRLEDVERPRLGVGALALGDAGTDAVARDRALDEDDVAVEAGHAAATVGERVDAQLELGAGTGSRGGGC